MTQVKHDPSPAKMIITVEGGLVQAIDGGPEGLHIEVWDLDANDDLAVENEKGELFWQTIWREGVTNVRKLPRCLRHRNS